MQGRDFPSNPPPKNLMPQFLRKKLRTASVKQHDPHAGIERLHSIGSLYLKLGNNDPQKLILTALRPDSSISFQSAYSGTV